MKATLRWAQLWGSCIFVLFMLGLLRPAYAFDIPGVGLRVCICAPWVLCPCEDPDAGQGGGGSDRPPPMQHDGRDGTRGPVGRSDDPAEQAARRHEEEQREATRKEEESRQHDAEVERERQLKQAWDNYRIDEDKAPEAEARANALLDERNALHRQYHQARAVDRPDFSQHETAPPSTLWPQVVAPARNLAQFRVYKATSGYSAHRSQDLFSPAVLSPSGQPFQTPPFSMDWQQLAAASDQYADAKVRITHFSNYHDERQALLDVSAVLIEVADDHFATGETGLGTGNVTTIRHLLDTAVDSGSAFVPPVSMALDAVQLSMGRNLFTGEPLTKWDAGLLLVDLVAFGCSKAFTKTARALVKVAAREGDAARLAKPWLSYIAKVDEAAQLIVPASQAAGPNFTLGEQADQAIAHFVQGAKLSPAKGRRVIQYEKSGDFEQAKRDLESLADGRQIIITGKNKNVFVTYLSCDVTVSARLHSRERRPTLEIRFGDKQTIKVRYDA